MKFISLRQNIYQKVSNVYTTYTFAYTFL